MKRLENFLIECQSSLTPGNSIWAALQCNTLNDAGSGYSERWGEVVEESRDRLDKAGFYHPNLEINFRNSSTVFACSNDIKSTTQGGSNDVQKVLGIPTTGTTTNSKVPRMFNFNWQYGHQRQEDLDDVVVRSYREMKQTVTDGEHDACLLL